ncbi:MAG TPA: tyrosine-type recombinase/integrase [Gemmataceae bacterium]|nr:tyrosine-type recombinase/integrase [Gemmataceae bacterium]
MRQSTKSKRARKPAKPHADFPLFKHAAGQWAKKIKGKMFYFGPIGDPDKALERYLAEKDGIILHGRRVEKPGGTDVAELCNRFLTTKDAMLAAGELSVHSRRDYYRVCESLVEAFGKTRLLTQILPDDFERLRSTWAAKWGPVRLGNEINRVRVVFNYAYKNGLIDRPMRYGEGFRRPSRKTLRLERASKGPKMFEAVELRRIVKAAGQAMQPMILLAINAGLGNNDVATLPLTALDLAGGWLKFPRPKTGIDRRCPLWPETVKAMRAWLKVRPEPIDAAHAGLVFVTSKRWTWAKDTTDNPVSKEMRKLLDGLEINGHRNFYALRHTFETIAGESRDQPAVDAIMGHAREDMASVYRERISDERLKAVAECVRTWLFPPKKESCKRGRGQKKK